jgi:hypothetical protein
MFYHFKYAERERDVAVRKMKQLERQLSEARQLSQLESRQGTADTEDTDRRIRLGRLEGENVLLRSAQIVTVPGSLDKNGRRRWHLV